MPYDDRAYWLERLNAKKAQLIELETTLAKVSAKPAMYTLNTSKSSYTEQQHSINTLSAQISKLEVEIDNLNAKVYGRGYQGRQGT